MSKALYDLDQDLAALIAEIEEADGVVTDEQNNLLDWLMDEREGKADRYIAVIKNAEAEAARYDAELKRLSARKAAAAGTADRLKSRLLASMQLHGEDVINGALGKIRRQGRTTTSVHVICDPTDLPERFRLAPLANRTALKAALESMDDDAVQIAELVQNTSEHVRIY